MEAPIFRPISLASGLTLTKTQIATPQELALPRLSLIARFPAFILQTG